VSNYVTLAGIGSIENQGGVVQIGTLDGQGGTLDLTADSPLNGVKVGTLKDITLITDGGSLDLTNGITLDDVTLNGMLSFGTYEPLSITGGFQAAGVDGTGPGTLDFPGTASSFSILDNETLDNLVVKVGGDPPSEDVAISSDIAPQAIASSSDSSIDFDILTQISRSHDEVEFTLWFQEFWGDDTTLTERFLKQLEDDADDLVSGIAGTNDGVFDPAAGANLEIQTTSFTNGGTIVSGSGDAFLITSTALSNTGTLDADGGLFGVKPALTGSGTAEVGAGGGLALESSVSAAQTIAFQPGGGILQLFDPLSVAGGITGFGPGDYIDLANINVTTLVASPGTLMALVLTASGAARPVRWIGERHLDPSRHPRPENVRPVRIARSAFGPNVPRRALHLSPDHAVFSEDVLIPVKYLINGSTVRLVNRRHLHYLHVELDTHDVILAEGLPVETYLDVGDRGRFENADVPIELHPDFVVLTWEAQGYAPLVVTGPKLAAVQSLLARNVASSAKSRRRVGA